MGLTHRAQTNASRLNEFQSRSNITINKLLITVKIRAINPSDNHASRPVFPGHSPVQFASRSSSSRFDSTSSLIRSLLAPSFEDSLTGIPSLRTSLPQPFCFQLAQKLLCRNSFVCLTCHEQGGVGYDSQFSTHRLPLNRPTLWRLSKTQLYCHQLLTHSFAKCRGVASRSSLRDHRGGWGAGFKSQANLSVCPIRFQHSTIAFRLASGKMREGGNRVSGGNQ